NGDGKLDLILHANGADGWWTCVALGRGDGTVSSRVGGWLAVGNLSGWLFATGDVNGDGKLDVILHANGADGWWEYVVLGRGDGTFSSPVSWEVAGGNWNGWSFTTGDVNGDGKLDVILHANDAGGWRTWVALARGN